MATRGRPRRADADEAILQAARELILKDGYAGFSIADVAQRAEVGRQSVYRRWPTKPMLAIASLTSTIDTENAFADCGSFEADLRAGLSALRSLYAQADATIFAEVYGAMAADPAAREYFRDHYLQRRQDSLRRAVVRAIARGELVPTTDVEIATELTSGPFLYRLLNGAAEFSVDLIDAITTSVLTLYGRSACAAKSEVK